MNAVTPSSWVYSFDAAPPLDAEALRRLLGGKGAGLAEMTRAGLRVPPGFTISTAACARFFADGGRWPAGLEEQVRRHMAELERLTGRRFGEGRRPLLVSVRSGAAVSMPGMMDTLLNCGLTPRLADEVGDSPAFWGLYLQFVGMFAKVVAGLDESAFAAAAGPPSRERAAAWLALYAERAGRAFPATPWDVLVEAINAVFRSWQNERAIAYRKRHDIRGLSGTAVNVQSMFPSQVSGILFTQDPNDLAAGRMVIEASYGLGEAVVSGDVTPDRFLVARDDFSKVRTIAGHKAHVVAALGEERRHDPDAPSLTAEQLRELCELALRVERLYGKPMDLEWGWADGELALLQARPIRGLDVLADVEAGRQEEIARLRMLAGNARRVWVIHNLGETLRAPTPLTWDIVRRFMSGSGGFGRMYRDFGHQPSPRVCQEGFLELVCGRIYADPERLAGLFWADLPLRYDVEEVLKDRRTLDRAPGRFEPEGADGRFLWRLPKTLHAMLRSARLMKQLRPGSMAYFEQTVLPPYLAYVEQKRGEDLRRLGSAELLAELDARCARVLDDFGNESLKPGFFGGLAYSALEDRLGQLMGQSEGAQLARALTTALEGDTTFEQDALLYKVAHGEAALSDFLARYGHRAAGEMELSEPRWREDPRYLEQVIAQYRGARGRAPAEMHRENAARREAAEQELPHTLAHWGGSSFREDVLQDLRDAQALLPYREVGKHYLMMGYELLRAVTEELARRWELGRDVYFLRREELAFYERDAKALRQTMAARKRRWQSAQRIDLPDVIDSTALDRLGVAPPAQAGGELRGDAVASGVAAGPARIVFDPREAGELGTGYILVCPSTDPGWTPLFMNARGLVVERGGILSHGAIVARDFGIPAVVCPNATRLIPNGRRIRVDGNSGRIALLEAEGAHA